MTKKINTKALLPAIVLASIFSSTVYADPYCCVPDKFLLFEVGGSYSHAFYKDNIRTAESHTLLFPHGVSINGSKFFPNNFVGGYIEVSLLLKEVLLNARYDMYANRERSNGRAGTRIQFSPAKLSFSVDKVWGCPTAFTFGPGVGVVISSINKGRSLTRNVHTLDNGQILDPVQGKTVSGRVRIDPLVEAFVMYYITPCFNVRFNVAYQIPVNSSSTNGSINANLGINYALPI